MAEPTQDPQTPASEVGLILAIAAILGVPGASPAVLLGPLVRLLRRIGVRPAATHLTLRVMTRDRVRRRFPPGAPGPGSGLEGQRSLHPDPWESLPAWPTPSYATSEQAQRQTAAEEVRFRAAFLLNSSRRIEDAWAKGTPPAEQAKREIRYWALHHQAAANRLERAREVDVASQAFGRLLGWYAVDDDRTSVECRRADGNNFRADQRPMIGWPGTVHPHCRCRPGLAHAGGRMVDQVVSASFLRRAHPERRSA